ncbi:MAG: twin-arginine translocation signal domain-containing protein [Phycisphaerae bacterium]|nr:twin-arginine translocation signal domain-containing protein [Phycisphaerae bacterium]
MCPSQDNRSCVACRRVLTRRDFVKGCGAALAAGGLVSPAGAADQPKAGKVRVALVYLSKQGSSWPSPVFDVAAREKEVLDLLKKGCPGIDFEPVAVRTPRDVKKAIALKDRVDGYLVYVLTLTWNLQRAITTIGKLGKPTIVADEFLGGSGAFLCGYSDLCQRGLSAAAVSTTRLDDLVAVARCFADVKKAGTTPASFAKQCQEAYRKTFPKVGEMKCTEDKLTLTDIAECVKRFKKSRFLIVGRGKPGRVQDFLGAKGTYIGFPELKALYDKVDPDKAAEWAKRWTKEADKVLDAKDEWIRKAGAVHLATLELLKKHGTDTVTMDCLGGFASGQLPAYPCLGFMQLLNDGGQGVCEAMPDDTLSMLMARILTGRPGYVSDPALDTSKNQIAYAHCVATTKVFGPKGKSNKFRIMTLHNRDPRGTCVRSFLPEGYMTTSFRTNFARKLMVIHQAKAVGNLESECGCRTQLVAEVKGDIANLFQHWRPFGWHRVTVYGDVKEPLIEFGKALGLKIVNEA